MIREAPSCVARLQTSTNLERGVREEKQDPLGLGYYYYFSLACVLSVPISRTGKTSGEPRTWEGSGFTAKHDCRIGSFCLRSFTCPNGKQIDFSQCVNQTCNPETPCPENHMCIRYSESVSYCVPKNLCQN